MSQANIDIQRVCPCCKNTYISQRACYGHLHEQHASWLLTQRTTNEASGHRKCFFPRCFAVMDNYFNTIEETIAHRLLFHRTPEQTETLLAEVQVQERIWAQEAAEKMESDRIKDERLQRSATKPPAIPSHRKKPKAQKIAEKKAAAAAQAALDKGEELPVMPSLEEVQKERKANYQLIEKETRESMKRSSLTNNTAGDGNNTPEIFCTICNTPQPSREVCHAHILGEHQDWLRGIKTEEDKSQKCSVLGCSTAGSGSFETLEETIAHRMAYHPNIENEVVGKSGENKGGMRATPARRVGSTTLSPGPKLPVVHTYPCPVCPKGYKYQELLYEHLSDYHDEWLLGQKIEEDERKTCAVQTCFEANSDFRFIIEAIAHRLTYHPEI